METFKTTLYICGCGYKTLNNGSATRHKKSSCGHEMKSESKTFLLEEEVAKHYGNAQPTPQVINNTGDHNINYIDQKQITFNLTVPDGDTRTIIYKALKSQQFQRELNEESQLENIPAMIFRNMKNMKT
jgi:hypothetical protein